MKNTRKNTVEEITDEEIRAVKRAYMRTWRRENKDKVAAYNRQYWARRAARELAETGGAVNGD